MAMLVAGPRPTWVDDEDVERISEYTLSSHKRANGKCYATIKINGTNIPLHRWLLGITDYTIHVRHADRNTLNNRKSNLIILNIGEA